MADLVLKEEVYKIVGAAMEVYYQLGHGFREPVYHEAFGIELQHRRIPFKERDKVLIYYKGQELEKTYEPDYICFGQVVTELKALNRLSGLEVSQLINYLKATKHPVGLLINFGSSVKLEWKRYVF